MSEQQYGGPRPVMLNGQAPPLLNQAQNQQQNQQQQQQHQHQRQQSANRPASNMSISAMLGHEGPNRDIPVSQQSRPAPLQVPFASKSTPTLPPTLGGKAQFNFGGLQYTPYRRNLTPDKARPSLPLDLQPSPSALHPDSNPMSPTRLQFGPTTPSGSASRPPPPFLQQNNFGGPGNPFSHGASVMHSQNQPMMEADFSQLAERQQQFDRQSIQELMRKSATLQPYGMAAQELEQGRSASMVPPVQYGFSKTPQLLDGSTPREFRSTLPFGPELPSVVRTPNRIASWPQNSQFQEDAMVGPRNYSSPMPPQPGDGREQMHLDQPTHSLGALQHRRMSTNQESATTNPRRQPNPHHVPNQQAPHQAIAPAGSGPSSISNSPTIDRSHLRQIAAEHEREPHSYSYSMANSQANHSTLSIANASRRPSQFGPALGVSTSLIPAPGRNSPLPQAVLGAMGPDPRLSYGAGPGEGIKSEFGKMFAGIGLGRNGGMSPSTPGRGSPVPKPVVGESEKPARSGTGPAGRGTKKGVKRPKAADDGTEEKDASGRKKRVRSATVSKKDKAKEKKDSMVKEQQKQQQQQAQAQEQKNVNQSVEAPLFGPYRQSVGGSGGSLARTTGARLQPKTAATTNSTMAQKQNSNEQDMIDSNSPFTDAGVNVQVKAKERGPRRQFDSAARPNHRTSNGTNVQTPSSAIEPHGSTRLDMGDTPMKEINTIQRIRHTIVSPRRSHPSPAPPLIRPPSPKLTIKSDAVLAAIRHMPSRHLGTTPYSARLETIYTDPPSHLSSRRKPTSASIPSSRKKPSRRPVITEDSDPDSATELPYKIHARPLPRRDGLENCTADILIPARCLAPSWLAAVRARHALWGSDVYTDDSDLLAVLLHLGILADAALEARLDEVLGVGAGAQRAEAVRVEELVEPRGGKPVVRREVGGKGDQAPVLVPEGWAARVRIRVLPRLVAYRGVVRNGVRSRDWGVRTLADGDGVVREGKVGGRGGGKRAKHDGVSFRVESAVFFRVGHDPGVLEEVEGRQDAAATGGVGGANRALPSLAGRTGAERRRRMETVRRGIARMDFAELGRQLAGTPQVREVSVVG